MVITYNKRYRPAGNGNGWQLFTDVNIKDSWIVWQLETTVRMNLNLSFDEIYLELKEDYKNKSVRSFWGFIIINKG